MAVTQGATGIGGLGKITASDSNYSFSPVEYSPDVLAYLAQLDAAAAARNPEVGSYYNALNTTGEFNNGDVNMPVYLTEEALRPYIGLPLEDNLGYQFSTEGKWGNSGPAYAGNQTPLALINDKTGEVISGGIGFTAAEQAAQQALAQGNGDWSYWAAAPGGTEYAQWADQTPQMGALEGIGKIISTVGPVIAGPLVGATGALGNAAAAAGASGLGATLQGKSIDDILKAAAISGIGSYASSQLFPTTSAPEATGGADVAGGAGGGASAGIGGGLVDYNPWADAIVTAGNAGGGLGGIGGILGGTGSNFLTGNSGNDAMTGEGDIDVVAPTTSPLVPVLGGIGAAGAIGAIGGAGGAGTGAGATGNPQTDPLNPESDALVTAPTATPMGPVPPLTLGTLVPGAPLVPYNPITIPEQPLPDVTPGNGGILGTGITASDIPTLVTGATGVIGGVADILGGGGDGGNDILNGGGGTVDIPAAIAASKRVAIRPDYNPFTYGQVGGDQPGEFAFYQGYGTNPVRAIDKPVTVNTGGIGQTRVAAPGYAHGGEVAEHAAAYASGIGHMGPGAISGEGGGQDDLIPAYVANDEYIWSAQDVADLGDGSSSEGHRRLDAMRQEVRRRAGRKDVKKIAPKQRGIGSLLDAVGA